MHMPALHRILASNNIHIEFPPTNSHPGGMRQSDIYIHLAIMRLVAGLTMPPSLHTFLHDAASFPSLNPLHFTSHLMQSLVPPSLRGGSVSFTIFKSSLLGNPSNRLLITYLRRLTSAIIEDSVQLLADCWLAQRSCTVPVGVSCDGYRLETSGCFYRNSSVNMSALCD